MKIVELILDEEYHDKENLKPQNDILAEESLYFGGFPSNKDKNLMEEFIYQVGKINI